MDEVPVPESIRADDRWEVIEDDDQQLADTALVTVTSRRVLYGDAALRERVRAATGIDRLWRSFFASRLTTRPALSPRIADLVVKTIALPQAKRRFAADLEARGFRAVTERDRREVDLGAGKRARAVRFSAAVPVEDAPEVPVDAWLAIWQAGEQLLVAGGIYPVEPLRVEDGEGLFDPPGEYRSELFASIRSVARMAAEDR